MFHKIIDTRTQYDKVFSEIVLGGRKLVEQTLNPPKLIKGMLVTKEGGKVTKIREGTQEVSLGQTVVANGHYGAENGTKGLVVELHSPYTGLITSDVICVQFEGQSRIKRVRFRDLKPLSLQC